MRDSSQDISSHKNTHFPRTSTAPNQNSRPLTPPAHHISPIPAFYLYRDSGVAVPLIALDELPPWLRIGREDWFNPEWQQYMNPVSEEPTIRVGEYEVFATWGGAVYQLPMWRLVAVRGGKSWDGTATGTGWEAEGGGGETGEDIMQHLDRRGGYGYRVDENMIDNGWLDGQGASPCCTPGGGSGDRHAVRGQDGEPMPIANNEVNREGITRNVPNTPPSSPMCGLSNSTYDGGADERFSCISRPLSPNGHNHYYPHYPQYQQDPPRQQAAMSSSPPAGPLELSRPLSNNSCSSTGQNPIHSLASNTDTETSVSSWNSSDIPHPAFHVPVIPRAPLGLGLTQSAPSSVFSGMHHRRIPPWLRNRVGGDGSVCSV